MVRRVASLLFLSFALCAFAQVAPQNKLLTNDDVLQMLKAGLPADVITAKIKNTGGTFDTSPSALKALKDAGASDAILLAVVNAAPAADSGEKAAPAEGEFSNAPDWAKRTYNAGIDRVYAAALRSIAMQKHEIKVKDDKLHEVDFHVGITAWSWGYNMTLKVMPIDATHSRVVVGVRKSGGKVFSWGRGTKEVGKILGGIDAELAQNSTP